MLRAGTWERASAKREEGPPVLLFGAGYLVGLGTYRELWPPAFS